MIEDLLDAVEYSFHVGLICCRARCVVFLYEEEELIVTCFVKSNIKGGYVGEYGFTIYPGVKAQIKLRNISALEFDEKQKGNPNTERAEIARSGGGIDLNGLPVMLFT